MSDSNKPRLKYLKTRERGPEFYGSIYLSQEFCESIQLGPEATDESEPVDELPPDIDDGVDDDPPVT